MHLCTLFFNANMLFIFFCSTIMFPVLASGGSVVVMDLSNPSEQDTNIITLLADNFLIYTNTGVKLKSNVILAFPHSTLHVGYYKKRVLSYDVKSAYPFEYTEIIIAADTVHLDYSDHPLSSITVRI